MSSSESPCTSGDENESTNDSQKLTSKQKEAIERNRQKAQELRAKKRPISHQPVTNVQIDSVKVCKMMAPTRVIDTGGGFLIEENLSSGHSSSTQVKVIHEPGALLDDDGRVCEECGKPYMESFLMNKFHKSVCDSCKELNDSSYKLITKSEAKTKYQLKDVDLDKREPQLKYIVKKNPRHDKWGEMKLYLESQVAARAFEVHGSEEQIEKEKEKKIRNREKAQQKKFEKNVKALRMAMNSTQTTKIHASHKHEFGADVYDPESDEYTKTCNTCGHSVTFEKM